MKKLITLSLSICCFFQISISQALVVQGEKGKIYLLHKVAPRENWYSVGRMYNISPKEIAPYNNSSLNTPLGIGQPLKIPLTEVNFSQTGEKTDDESLVPVYHALLPNENINRISAMYNAVPVTSLETWNNIKKSPLKPGAHLIIGYLRVKTSLSSLASGSKNVPVLNSKKNQVLEESNESSLSNTENKPTASQKQGADPLNGSAALAGSKPVAKNTSVAYRSNGSGGYFVSEYTEGTRSKIGLAGTFKSTSGWQDGKYYALMNNVQVGTIIKVIAPATQKSVYAKVLGQLPDMKESDGLTIRISSAAATELNEPEGKFNVEVKY
jgi:hypothetical protein